VGHAHSHAGSGHGHEHGPVNYSKAFAFGIALMHIWGISTTESALTAHLVRPAVCDDDELLLRAYADLHSKFGIGHATLQIERGHGPHGCALAPADVV